MGTLKDRDFKIIRFTEQIFNDIAFFHRVGSGDGLTPSRHHPGSEHIAIYQVRLTTRKSNRWFGGRMPKSNDRYSNRVDV